MDLINAFLQNTLPKTNPVDESQLQAIVVNQGKNLVACQEQLTVLQATKTHLMQALLSSRSIPPQCSEPALPKAM